MSSEFELIAQIRERLGEGGGRVVVGSGDDAAVVRCDGVTVTSIDAFVEGVHFRLATTSLRDLGHKCLAAALSDIAAMGAVAGEAYFAICVAAGVIDEHDVLELVQGAQALAARSGVTICGGDIVRSDELMIAVTAIGHGGSDWTPATRSGVKAGDMIGVTGELGGAGAGLALLEKKLSGIDAVIGERLIDRCLRPLPRLEAGLALAEAPVNAMIDVSDGIASDASRLAEMSSVALEIELDRLPVQDGVDEVAEKLEIDSAELAATAGDDYELLVSCGSDRRVAVEAAAASAGIELTWIGKAAGGAGVRLLGADGARRELSGWDQLRSAPRVAAHRRRRA